MFNVYKAETLISLQSKRDKVSDQRAKNKVKNFYLAKKYKNRVFEFMDRVAADPHQFPDAYIDRQRDEQRKIFKLSAPYSMS